MTAAKQTPEGAATPSGANQSSIGLTVSNHTFAAGCTQAEGSLAFGYLDNSGQFQQACASGRAAQTLMALLLAQNRGLSQTEAIGWGLRLSCYIQRLRKMGLDIATIRDPYAETNSGRYVLRSQVHISLPHLDKSED